MSRILLALPPGTRRAIWRHLLPGPHAEEETAFVYARWTQTDASGTFEFIDWTPVPPLGFLSRSECHLELSDEARSSAIKRAHDLGASLVEFHSHTRSWPARFSPSDLAGFGEFVPHVWWRLKGRPYLAVVVSRSGFDGLAWTTGPRTPQRLTGILDGGELLRPTGLSSLNEEYHEY